MPVAAWFAVMATAFALFAIRAGQLRKPAYYFLEWTLASPMIVYGLLLHPHPADTLRVNLEPSHVYRPSAKHGGPNGQAG